MDVYAQGNLENAREMFPREDPAQWPLLAEQEFHQYLRECFFQTPGAVYAIWAVDGRYVSALRLEPYQDGLLLEALETAPNQRRKGYAVALINAVFEKVRGQKIYSHVSKKNFPSLETHKACGFEMLMDYAVYSDGSVLRNNYTLSYKYKKSEIL
jgi:GNAT superfamily N-acetyltransferase